MVTCGALEQDVDEKSFVTCTEAQAEIKVRVGRVFHVNQVFGVEYVVSVLVFVLDVAGGQCGIALSVLIERPVVNLFLRLEQAFGFIHRPYHAAASHTAQVRSNARLIAEIQIFVLTLGQCQVYVVLHLADGVAVGQCQVPTPGFQFAEVHVGHVAVHTGRRWVEIRRGCCDFIRFVPPIVFEGQAEAVVPETQVCSDVIVMRLSPRQFGIGNSPRCYNPLL